MVTKEIIAESLKQPDAPQIRQRSFAEVLAEKENATKQETPITTKSEEVKTSAEAVKPVAESEIKTEAVKEAIKDVATEDTLQKLLRELNLKSVDELKEKVKPTPKKSKDQELSEALDYGIRNEKLKMDDYNEAVKLSGIPPKELVFKKFAEKQKELNPKISEDQIQAKFNRKYGEEVESKEVDEDGNPVKNIVFDESELQSEAEQIIKSVWEPIKNLQKDYSEYTTKEEQIKAIKSEAEELKSQIPSSVKWKVGETEFEYTIDDSFKSQIEQKVIDNFIGVKQIMASQGIKSNEKFDVAEITRFVVQDVCFNNILSSHAATFANQRVEKELAPFKNTTTDKTLEMANQSTKRAFTEDPIAAADRIAKLVRR